MVGGHLDQVAPVTIKPLDTLVLNVTFTPTMTGAYAATLEIDCQDPQLATTTINLTGTGVAAMVEVSPKALDFGALALGKASDPQLLTIKNSGTSSITLDKVTSDDVHFVADLTGITTTIMGGASVMVPVVFTPTAVPMVSGAIKVYLKGVKDPVGVTVTVTGEGLEMTMPVTRNGGCGLSPQSPAAGLAGLLPVGMLLAGLALGRRRRAASRRSV